VRTWEANSGKLTVTLFVQIDHLSAAVFFWWMQSVEVSSVCAQLFDGSCSESVACRNQHAKVVLNQPEADLKHEAKFSFIGKNMKLFPEATQTFLDRFQAARRRKQQKQRNFSPYKFTTNDTFIRRKTRQNSPCLKDYVLQH